MREAERAGAAGETGSGGFDPMLWLGILVIVCAVVVLVLERRRARVQVHASKINERPAIDNVSRAPTPPAPLAQADGAADFPAGVHAPIAETMAVEG